MNIIKNKNDYINCFSCDNGLASKNIVSIVYFSGTGGTRKVAETFFKIFKDRGIATNLIEYNKKEYKDIECNMLIVLYPIYAFNAPIPIFEFLDSLPKVKDIYATVISVSGGGEITPNRGCRYRVIKELGKKGFRVVYEEMIVMPANCYKISDDLFKCLLNVMPKKVNRIVNDLLSGIVRRIKPGLFNVVCAYIVGNMLSKYGCKSFAKGLTTKDTCNKCGLCVKICPRDNISMVNNKIIFGEDCVLCMRCIYACPNKAITGRRDLASVSFDINKFDGDTSFSDRRIIEITKGLMLKGVRNYLLSK